MKITQEQRTLEYMKKFGGITSKEAFNDLGITRLSAKIYNLKRQGYVIVDEIKQSKNRFGEITHFKKYMLADEQLIQNNLNHIPEI